ncbi:MAG: hypothetical protein ACP5HK_04435 [Acidilobus sp.]
MAASITVSTLLERLMAMSQGVEDATTFLLHGIDWKSPNAESVEKIYRQDLMAFKDVVSKGREGILDFMVNGRLTVIPYKEFFIEASLQLECIMSRLEAGTYRLLLLLSLERSPLAELLENVRSLLRELQSSSMAVVDILRASEAPPRDPAMRRKLIDDKFVIAADSEARADSIYRQALARIIAAYASDPAKMMIFKEVIDAFEDAVDCAYNASTYVRLVGLGMYG